MKRSDPSQTGILFDENFMEDHVHNLLRQPDFAVVELIANAYDAGATRVDVCWPEDNGGELSIEDNGTGMSTDELQHRWRTLCYNRPKEQGSKVVFPPGVQASPRIAFGQSGKGRHAMFCFARSYQIETWKDGILTKALVTRIDAKERPFTLNIQRVGEHEGHGTRIWAEIGYVPRTVKMVQESVGTKFIVDPSFSIYINGQKLDLLDLQTLERKELTVPNYGKITVTFLESPSRDRTMQMRGITWWVIGRMVGRPSWEGLDTPGSILDGRTTEAHKYSFVIMADFLKEDLYPDWTDFRTTDRVAAVKKFVGDYVSGQLSNILSTSMVEKKKEAIRRNVDVLRPLPKVSRTVIGEFINKVQQQCHHITDNDLTNLVCIIANMEIARSGYDLLRKLAACSADDIDTWNAIMEEWDATRAKIVLNELGRRMGMIEQLEIKAHDPSIKELCDLQPLFESNLWVFGPEYECVDFTSNRTMVTVLRQLLKVDTVEKSPKRPDFVVLPDSTIGAYSAPDYEDGEVSGVRKILIVELKRGGFTLHQKEMIQGLDYANKIREKAGLSETTEIIVYVLGAQIASSVNTDLVAGSTQVKAMIFSTVLNKANARTFYLLNRIRETVGVEEMAPDRIVEEILSEPVLIESMESPEMRS